MKRFFLLTIGLLLLGYAVSAQPDSNRCVLNAWYFYYQGKSYKAHVPGCIHTDLRYNDLIVDPYYGTNEERIQWVSDTIWTYTTTLDSKMLRRLGRQSDSVWLVFDGLETYADVRLDGVTVARTNNMFRQWRIALPRELLRRSNDHQLTVTFYPTAVYDAQQLAQWGQGHPDARAFSRTAPYQQGWDWGPRLATCGIWKEARLEWQPRRGATTVDTAVIPVCRPTRYRLVSEPDSIGQSFFFVDNNSGDTVFMKGANWIPVSSFPSLTSDTRRLYRNALIAAKEANITLLRVWGGGIYEHDYFFDLCDSLGLLVWVDFVFAGTFYPNDSAFLDNVRHEAEQQVQRLASHPCVVVWCGNNEVKNGWDDWGWRQQYAYSDSLQRQIVAGIDTLFGKGGILDRAVHRYLPADFPYWPTSPLYGWGHAESNTHGDAHYWGVWWGEFPFELYREHTGRFMSEFGFQSYPQMSTIAAFCPPEERYLGSPTLNAHQKHARGLAIIDKALRDYFGVSAQTLTLPQFVYYSQLAQAYATGMGIESHLMRRGYCQGTLYWQLNDCWPVASWSSVDYYGNWKALHYRVRDLYSDTTIVAEPAVSGPRPLVGEPTLGTLRNEYSARRVRISVVGNATARVRVRALSTAGSLLDTATLVTRGDAYYELPAHIDTAACVLELTTPGAPRRLYPMVRPCHLRIPAAVGVRVRKLSDTLFEVSNESPAIAFAVQLTARDVDDRLIHGNFSNNYFDLLPGEHHTVRFLGNADRGVWLTAVCLHPAATAAVETQ